jgi:hypothetical protein
MANVSRASSLDQKRLALATRGTTLDHTLYVFFFFMLFTLSALALARVVEPRGDPCWSQGGGRRDRGFRDPHRKFIILRLMISSGDAGRGQYNPCSCTYRSAGERADAAVGKGQHQPHRAGAHHLHGCRVGLLHRRRQEGPVAREAALVRGSP